MAKDQIDELEQKKQQLQNELNQIQDELDSSLGQVRDDVSSSLNPKRIIQKYPLSVVGASALLGFLLGHKGKGNSTDASSSPPSPSFSANLFAELKRLATRKAVTFATDYVEELIESKADKHLSSDEAEKKD